MSSLTDAVFKGPLPLWKVVWRTGFVPVLPRAGLEALADALRADDRRLLQGATTCPPPLMCVRDWPCEAGCPLAFVGAALAGGFGATRVGEAELFFANACFQADERLGEPAGCRWLLNWWDDTPRLEAFRELLAEVELALEQRSNAEVVA